MMTFKQTLRSIIPLLVGFAIVMLQLGSSGAEAACRTKGQSVKIGQTCCKWLERTGKVGKKTCQPCGGTNQSACTVSGCKNWLENKKGVCRACGGNGQSPCGLARKCKAGHVIKNYKCVAATSCGGNGQAPCGGGKGCDSGFVLWTRDGKCHPTGERIEEMGETIEQAVACRKKGEKIWGAFTCCDGLVRKDGKCVDNASCGGLGQERCGGLVGCDAGFTWWLRDKKCHRVGERIEDANEKLQEAADRAREAVEALDPFRKEELVEWFKGNKEAVMREFGPAIELAERLAKHLQSQPGLLEGLRNHDSESVATILEDPEFAEVKNSLEAKRGPSSGQAVGAATSGNGDQYFKTITVGAVIDGQAFLTAAVSGGQAIDIADDAPKLFYGFITPLAGAGLSVGVDYGAEVGVYKARADKIYGFLTGFTVGLAAGAGGSLTVWFSNEQGATDKDLIDLFEGFSIVIPQLGTSAEIEVCAAVTCGFDGQGCGLAGSSADTSGGDQLKPMALSNFARGKNARQSSTYAGNAGAGAAVDGNTDGIYAHRSTTHTNQESQPWWEVDLGASHPIEEVRLWNREDCCANRLSKFKITISDTPFTDRKPMSLGKPLPGKGITTVQVDSVGRRAAIPIKGKGRYVRIQLNGSGILSLAEVEVMGK